MDSLSLLVPYLEAALSGQYFPEHTQTRKSRTGEIYKTRFGTKDYAVKVYREGGYYGDLKFYTELLGTGVPVPRVYAHDDSLSAIPCPWLAMDWLDGDQEDVSAYGLGYDIGRQLHAVHARPADGSGGYGKDGWEYAGWHAFASGRIPRSLDEVAEYPEDGRTKGILCAAVNEAALLALRMPDECRLLHGDLSLDNVIHKACKVVGFIDTGWCLGGQPVMDIGTFLNSSTVSEVHARGFADGYGRDFPEPYVLAVFRMYLLTGKMTHYLRMGDMERYQMKKAQILTVYSELA